MKKLLLILLCLPLLFSCGDTDNLQREISWKDIANGYTGKGTFKDVSTYVGEFKNGNFHGQGTMHYSADGVDFDGDKYVGEWKDGWPHGQGTETYVIDGKYLGEYVGEWKDDMRHGQGTNTFDGDKYVGEWKDDMRNGQGTNTYADGTIKKGLWYYNKFLGE